MSSRIGRPPHPDTLTPAEWRVLEQVRAGRPNAEIAVRLGISVNTVRTHVSHMLEKLEVRDRYELASWEGAPKRRFGWLPSIPLPTIALGGSFVRGSVIAGGAAAAAAVVVAIVLATSGGAEARTNVLLRIGAMPYGSRLIALDPLTGAPLEGSEPLDLTDRFGGPLTTNGSLFWRRPDWDEPSPDTDTVITVVSGGPLGLANPQLTADEDGIIRQWILPATGQPAIATLFRQPHRSRSTTAYGTRSFLGASPDELWSFDLTSDGSKLLLTAPGIAGAIELSDGRLFAAVHSERLNLLDLEREFPEPDSLATWLSGYLADSDDYVVQLDPHDGSEIARVEVGGLISSIVMAPDERSMFVLGAVDGVINVIDLTTMSTEQLQLPADAPQPGALWLLGPIVFGAISPDGKQLYLAGTDRTSCISGDIPCEPVPLGFHVIELATMQVRYADPAPDHFAMSADGRWLVTAARSSDLNNLTGGDGLKVIDARTLEVVAHLKPDAPFESVVIEGSGRYAYASANGPRFAGGLSDCSSSCGTVSVIDLDRLEVIAEHVYDEPVQWLTIVE